MIGILRLAAVALLAAAAGNLSVLALAQSADLPRAEVQLALNDQAGTGRSCSCSTGVGACHISWHPDGETCDASTIGNEKVCTGTCAFGPSEPFPGIGGIIMHKGTNGGIGGAGGGTLQH
jgi:hypothetical protein